MVKSQKISDELSTRVTRIVNDLDTKNNTSEIKKTFIEMNKRLSVEVKTKITNELFACISAFFLFSLRSLVELILSLIINSPQRLKILKHVMLAAGYAKESTE